MSLQSFTIGLVPEETERIARAAFPRNNPYLLLRDELGTIYHNQDFADLFSQTGQPAETPWRLALVTILQFAEGLSDRQAAEAVRDRIAWKYLLGLELTDPGFDYSVLCQFRARLLAGEAEEKLLSLLLELCRNRGWLKARGRARTDSTHVLAAVRTLNRLELAGETLRAALNSLATVAPDWLRGQVDLEWFERYGRRIENYRLPKTLAHQQALAAQIGADGSHLLTVVYANAATPRGLPYLEAVQVLRQVWLQQFMVQDGQLRWRDVDDMPPAALLIQSPYDPEARYSTKRESHWTGYKAHVTESCDTGSPHLITNVQTTLATTPDCMMLEQIHDGLAAKNLLPQEHLVDAGYIDAGELVQSESEYDVRLVGPARTDTTRQGLENEGFAASCFAIDWQAKNARCPQGHTSKHWRPQQDERRGEYIQIEFAGADCRACPSRVACTRDQIHGRRLSVQPQAQHEALAHMRVRQRTTEFKKAYAARAGIEGTLSQGVRGFEVRQSRYRGLAKTHLQHIISAVAINLARLVAWLSDLDPEQTRLSHFARLAPMAPMAPTPTMSPVF